MAPADSSESERLPTRLATGNHTANPATPHADMRRLLRDVRAGIGFLALGALLGGGAFTALDMMAPGGAPRAKGVLSLREPYSATCREAIQSGQHNIPKGAPGYRDALDADGNGLACEPYLQLRK